MNLWIISRFRTWKVISLAKITDGIKAIGIFPSALTAKTLHLESRRLPGKANVI